MNKNILVSLFAGLLLVGAAAPVVAQDKAAPAAVTYNVDKIHSSVLFKVQHMNAGMFYGQFLDFSGAITETAKGLDIKWEVKTDSVFTNVKKRDDHLRSPDFFNAKEFPVLKFESTASKKKGKNFEVTGNLTINGKTNPVTIVVEPTGTGKGMQGETLKGYHTEFTIKRSAFGMQYMQGAGLGDEVTLIISAEAGAPK